VLRKGRRNKVEARKKKRNIYICISRLFSQRLAMLLIKFKKLKSIDV